MKEVIGDVIRGLERDRPGTEKRRYRMISVPAPRRRFSRWPQNVCSVSVCRLWSVTWFVTLTARKHWRRVCTGSLPIKIGQSAGALKGKKYESTHIFQRDRQLASAPADLTPGQTDMIKTVALVLMVTDHTGLLLAGNNEVMRLLGRGCFPLFGLAWGMNLARHAEIRQSQLNSLWAGRWSPSVVYAYWIPVVYREYSVCLCRYGPVLWVSQPSPVLHPPGGWTAGHPIPLSTGSYGMAGGHAHRQLAALSRTACTGTAGIRGAGPSWCC